MLDSISAATHRLRQHPLASVRSQRKKPLRVSVRAESVSATSNSPEKAFQGAWTRRLLSKGCFLSCHHIVKVISQNSRYSSHLNFLEGRQTNHLSHPFSSPRDLNSLLLSLLPFLPLSPPFSPSLPLSPLFPHLSPLFPHSPPSLQGWSRQLTPRQQPSLTCQIPPMSPLIPESEATQTGRKKRRKEEALALTLSAGRETALTCCLPSGVTSTCWPFLRAQPSQGLSQSQ